LSAVPPSSRHADAAPRGAAREAYIDALARTGVGMVCVLERDGRIAIFDDGCERATGFAAEEVIGRDARDVVIPPDECDLFTEFLTTVWRKGMSSPQVGHWLTRDGDRRLISWSNRPILDESGEMTQLFTVGIDLTERDRANAELRAVHDELAERLYELEQLAAEQSGLRRVALLVAGEATPAVLFDAAAGEVARLFEAETAAVVRFGDGEAVFVGRFGGPAVVVNEVGTTVSLEADSAVARVFRTGSSARIDAYDELAGETAEVMRDAGYRCSAAAPVAVGGRLWGALVVAATSPEALPPETTERRLEAFAQLVALALATADAREQLHASRKRLVQVADEERRRLERDLHDGAQQRLVSIGQRLHLAKRFLGDDAATLEQLEISAAEVAGAIEDLRRLANGLHPAILTEAGLRPALASLARRSALPVTVQAEAGERFAAEIETAAYYLVSEALTNSAKHAEATCVDVRVQARGDRLVVEIADDGRGGASLDSGTGLRGLNDRVEAVGGTLSITSSPKGTILLAELPLS
jgi:PAS domain S-box-containing protein